MAASNPLLMKTTPESDETLETYRALLRTALYLKRAMKTLFSRYNLTGAQFGTLTRIPPEGIPLTHLAEMAWADPGNVSGIVDRLEREGWVQRQRSSQDRRVVLIALTAQGRALLDEILPQHRAAVRQVMGGLTAAERATLRDLLARIEGRVGEDIGLEFMASGR